MEHRAASGAHVFRDEDEADRFEALRGSKMKRDDFKILAWCLMSDHFQTSIPRCLAPLCGTFNLYRR